jgi:ribosomal protein L29
MMLYNELSVLDLADLKDKLIVACKDLFVLNMQHKTGQLKNTSLILAARKHKARIKTALASKGLR